MRFVEFRKALQENFAKMTEGVTHLFEVAVDKDELWNLYLDSFPSERNKIYRERREHDCSCCRQFVKNFGNVVVIKDNIVHSIWDLTIDDDAYQTVADALSKYVKSHPVTDVYVSFCKSFGTRKTREMLPSGNVKEWDHFYLNIPRKFVTSKYANINELRGNLRDTRNVFKRSLDEITEESIQVILELISQNSLYRGEEWKEQLTKFLEFKKEYVALETDNEKENFAWEQSVIVGAGIGRIRNHSIGTLLVDISNDVELNTAVTKYELMVAPANYKRPKAIYTKKMLEDAKKQISELGYLNSLRRRFATLDDISVNNILFSNRDIQHRISNTDDLFGTMEKDIAVNPKRFSKVEEVSIDTFVENILPTANEVEVLLENRHEPNMVSLIAPQDMTAPSMFKWNNGFSWAYSGNIADSDIRENVKSAGGSVDGVLRFSIQWNDTKEHDGNDLDAHCIEPNGREIMFDKSRNPYTGGNLDVDVIDPIKGKPAVENITWPLKGRMLKGTYRFFVHCYSNRGGRSGFRAEIEFDGNIYKFDYRNELRHKEDVMVAEVTFDGKNFSIKELLPSNLSVREIWGVKTNQFVPVSVVMYSPNYWDEQDGIGNKHYFFMLKDCINNERPNAFYNEYLKNELLTHKRVFEALGSKAHVEDSPEQLSGIGFSSTRRNELIVKVKSATERIIKIKF